MQLRRKTHNIVVKHVITSTRNPRVLPPTLPDQLQQIIHARQDIVHEHDRIKHDLLVLPQLMQRHQRCVPNLCQVLNPMIERSPRPHTRPDLDPQSSDLSESVKDSEEGFGLVGGSVLVDGDVDVGVS